MCAVNGAQILVALAAIDLAGYYFSAFEIIPYILYPMILLVCLLISIAAFSERDKEVVE